MLKSLFLPVLKLAIVVDCAILPLWSVGTSTLLHKAWAPCTPSNTADDQLVLDPDGCSRVQYPHDSIPVSQGLPPWKRRLHAPSSPCSRTISTQGPALPSSAPYPSHQHLFCLQCFSLFHPTLSASSGCSLSA
ncbi:hypothetical protein BKA66DRAFT_35381 [Pyrenochaeta sp. MPI-SDFR-AT-0127]|nr:hypothetical protein BKA66DRAFT_35381 [Pyrenochaeta sp. MPI-SDFR-AT-0127]